MQIYYNLRIIHSISVFSLSKHAHGILVVGAHSLEWLGCSVDWVFPDWILYILLVCNSVWDWIFDVGGIPSNVLVIPVFR